jgi:hypothetical protein
MLSLENIIVLSTALITQEPLPALTLAEECVDYIIPVAKQTIKTDNRDLSIELLLSIVTMLEAIRAGVKRAVQSGAATPESIAILGRLNRKLKEAAKDVKAASELHNFVPPVKPTLH